MAVMLVSAAAAIQCYNCRLEVPPSTKVTTEYKIYELEGDVVKEVCNKTKCEEKCVTIKDTGAVNETGTVYYQTCDGEDAVCNFFGIEEEYCNKTTCAVDLCNNNGESKIAYTLSLVSVAIVYLFW
ncbi:uncharacterized protein LOC134813452 [Bolinopsis microptera]|uniref:uncharacterized protein LOC134813452 n=1 Tax=Bolinopsis microptera TaxID=2820187 RepID=UPI00307AB71B